MDSILSYHLNPLTCGVAKFNLVMGRRMGLPVLGILDPAALEYERPLLSLKMSEWEREDIGTLDLLLDLGMRSQAPSLFWHDFGSTAIELKLLRKAEAVYCGNTELANRLRAHRPDVVELWCPGTLSDTEEFREAELSVFSFGMAHKIRSEYYRRLHRLLERTGKSYCVYLSTALHEGTSFEDSFQIVYDELREVFNGRVYFLGYLSDAAVYNYLCKTTFFAAFFDKGVRANNTSINSAMEYGSVVITNLDQYSPSPLRHLENVLDISRCEELPTDAKVLAEMGQRARVTATEALGWKRLTESLLVPSNGRAAGKRPNVGQVAK